MADIHQVVIHRPGPAWQAGVDFREQPGVVEHVMHYRKLMEQGQLAWGGPFLVTDGGGMMVATSDVSAQELTVFAASDPAVHAGLLTFEVRPWYVAMKQDR